MVANLLYAIQANAHCRHFDYRGRTRANAFGIHGTYLLRDMQADLTKNEIAHSNANSIAHSSAKHIDVAHYYQRYREVCVERVRTDLCSY